MNEHASGGHSLTVPTREGRTSVSAAMLRRFYFCFSGALRKTSTVELCRNENMPTLEKFRVRPGYPSKELLVEFCGDHRASSYPDISNLIQSTLNAKPKEHPDLDTLHIGLATDESINLWEYSNSEYEHYGTNVITRRICTFLFIYHYGRLMRPNRLYSLQVA